MLRFGPPRSFTCASACPWLGHLVSGLLTATWRPIQARFHCASNNCFRLATVSNSLDRSTKSTPSPPRGLRLLVRTQFQDLFHSPSGVLLTFPSRYLYTIDRKIYLALGGGPPSFSQGFTCPDLLDNINDKVCETWRTRLSLSMAHLSKWFCSPRKFFTLCRLMVASATFAEIWTSPALRKR
jgi:hypothetical protein